MISSYLIVEMCDFDGWGWAGGRSRKKILGLRTWPRDFLLWAMRIQRECTTLAARVQKEKQGNYNVWLRLTRSLSVPDW